MVRGVRTEMEQGSTKAGERTTMRGRDEKAQSRKIGIALPTGASLYGRVRTYPA